MAKETDVNFDYIPNKRYIIEIKDENTGEIHLSKRITSICVAKLMKKQYNSLKGVAARLFDTKTGEVT